MYAEVIKYIMCYNITHIKQNVNKINYKQKIPLPVIGPWKMGQKQGSPAAASDSNLQKEGPRERKKKDSPGHKIK